MSPLTSTYASTFARQWMTNLANSVKGDTVTPPVAARTYAYGSIAIYEAVVNGMPGYRSLGGQLNGLGTMPAPDPSKVYDWPTVLAATMDRMVGTFDNQVIFVYPERLFYEFTTFTEASLRSLGRIQIGHRRAAGVAPQVINDSVAFANQIADVLIPWVQSDGYSEARYKGFIPPKGPQYWVPTGFSDTDKAMPPVEPHFGDIRPLVMASPSECAPPAPIAFSDAPGSDFYAQADAVHATDIGLTKEQRETALYWADGPGATATPAGHWLAITSQIVRPKKLDEAAVSYAKVGMGFLDSFIGIWQSKYQYNVLRPETYIRRNIDPTWRPLLPTPQFPSYLSGHSGLSGASSMLLTSIYGGGPFTDNTKTRRGFAARSFASFDAAAHEAADSRLYGGIHYPSDNSEGMALGHCVADKILARVHFTD